MKVRVIRNTFYNLEYIKGTEGRIIDFKGNKLPSWAEKIKEDKKQDDKKQENKTHQSNEENKTDGNKAPEIKNTDSQKDPEDEKNKTDDILNEVEKQQYLDLLINEAIEKDILIEDADKKSVDEQIAELEAKLKKGK